MNNTVIKLATEFNRYFTSSNRVDVPARVTVSRDEWRQLFQAIEQSTTITLPPGDVSYFDGLGDIHDGYTANTVVDILLQHGQLGSWAAAHVNVVAQNKE